MCQTCMVKASIFAIFNYPLANYLGSKEGIGRVSDSSIQEQRQIWTQKRNCLWEARKRTGNLTVSCISLNVPSTLASQPPCKLCVVIARQKESSGVCISTQALPPEVVSVSEEAPVPNALPHPRAKVTFLHFCTVCSRSYPWHKAICLHWMVTEHLEEGQWIWGVSHLSRSRKVSWGLAPLLEPC